MNAIEAFVPPEIVQTFAAFLEFCYIARRNIITDDSLEQLKVALHKFHQSRQVFSGTVRAVGLSGFSLPRQHAMVHYYDHIKNFGSPNGLCSSITESKHIATVKRPWRRSNKHAALPQMLKVNERLDKLAAARADFAARGMLAESCLIQTIRNVFTVLDEDIGDLMDEDVHDTDESDDPTPDEINMDPLARSNTDTLARGNVATHVHNDADACTRHNANTHTPGTNNDNNNDDDDDDDDNDDDDNDHGPVESGPLMNEVRLACKKGQTLFL